MFAVLNILRLIVASLRAAITPVKTNPGVQANIEQDGALIPGGPLINAFQALAQNASPVFGNWNSTLIPNSLSATTYLGNQLVGGIIRRFGFGAATTDSTDTATNIVNAIPGAVVGQTFPLIIANLGSGALTIAGGTGVTMAGTAVVASQAMRLFLGQVTGSAAVTITNQFQWGGGSGYTGASGL